MKVIAEVAKKHDLMIIADEVYREFVYDGRTPASFGQLKEYEDRVIIIDSVSKRFSACGARIGLCISKNKEFMSGIMKIDKFIDVHNRYSRLYYIVQFIQYPTGDLF